MFPGGFGAHRFYLQDNLGIFYLLFFWTQIPSLVRLVEAFFMPDRVRAYNSREELIEAVRIHLAAGGAGAEGSAAAVSHVRGADPGAGQDLPVLPQRRGEGVTTTIAP